MKNRVVCTSVCSLLLILVGILIGVKYHWYFLSVCVDVRRMDIESNTNAAVGFLGGNAPGSFQVSPGCVDRIYSLLLHKSSHSLVKYLYSDAVSYYVLADLPPDLPPCGYYAKLIGTRINGFDGSVWNPTLQKWEHKGNLNLSIRNSFTNGESVEEVLSLCGEPARILPFKSEDGDAGMMWEYWYQGTADVQLVAIVNGSVYIPANHTK
jgi:hypothetical protein